MRSGVAEIPRTLQFQSLHLSAKWADSIRSWTIMRQRTIWIIRKGLGCIWLAIQEVKTGIPAK